MLSLGTAGLAMLCPCPPSVAGSPYEEGKALQYGLNEGWALCDRYHSGPEQRGGRPGPSGCRARICRRIRPCPGGYNPNCVSTASLNDVLPLLQSCRPQAHCMELCMPCHDGPSVCAQLYAPVWQSPEADADVSAQFLERAVSDACPDAQLVSVQALPDGQFRAYTVPSLFGRDVME